MSEWREARKQFIKEAGWRMRWRLIWSWPTAQWNRRWKYR